MMYAGDEEYGDDVTSGIKDDRPTGAVVACRACGIGVALGECCEGCGVYHGDRCAACGEYGYHLRTCPEMEDDAAYV